MAMGTTEQQAINALENEFDGADNVCIIQELLDLRAEVEGLKKALNMSEQALKGVK